MASKHYIDRVTVVDAAWLNDLDGLFYDTLAAPSTLAELQGTLGITTNTSNIATNTANIATNTANIATNAANIATHDTEIDDLDTRLSVVEVAGPHSHTNKAIIDLITDAGSGAIITSAERTNLGNAVISTVSAMASTPYAVSGDSGTVFRATYASGDLTVNLPAATDGVVYTFKRTLLTNDVVINPDGAETIDGDADLTLLAGSKSAVTLVGVTGVGWDIT